MAFSRWAAVAGAVLLSSVAFTAACSEDDGSDPKPCTVSPAFVLTVRAVSGPLPPDTKILVSYSGGTESYGVDTGNTGQEIVLCEQEGADAGDAGTAVMLLRCELWTQSAAKLTVSASGFPTIKDRELKAVTAGKCFETVPVEIVLGDQDAAP